MKNKKNKLLIIILSVVIGLVIVGGATIGALVIFHKHSYSTEWVYDESCHWHNATCSHKEEISDKGEHEWVKESVVAPTCTAQGYTNYSCSVCGATKKADYTEMIDHTPQAEWQIDDTTGTHWQNCSVCGGKQELAEHTLVKDYSVVTSSDDGSISSVTTTERCTLCAKTYTPVTLETSDYVVLTPENITDNAKTFTDDNKVYILNGTFNNTQFIFDAENVTVVGSGATTAGIKFSYTENADNSVLYGCSCFASSTLNTTIEAYGSLAVINCTFVGCVTFNLRKNDLNVIVDSCTFSDSEYGIYINYGYENLAGENISNGMNLFITNSNFNMQSIYCIFLSGNSASAEAGNIEIANNSFCKWGTMDELQKRATLKFHTDIKYSPVVYDDEIYNDTSYLTPEMRRLAKKMARNNTFDKGTYENGEERKVSYFNIDGICFDTVD